MNVHLKQTITLAFAFLSYALSGNSTQAASLELDQNFRPPLFAEPSLAQRVVLLPDSKFLVFYFTDTLADQRAGAITRYLSDGTLDSSFHASRDYKEISAAAQTSNGELIIAAIQYTYGTDFGSEQILRLNADGSIDPTFAVSVVHSEPYTTVRSIVVQSDNKILVAGGFPDFSGSGHACLVRLLSDGSPDLSFVPAQFDDYGYGIYPSPVFQTDGKILVAGDFHIVSGSPIEVPGIARLNADGSYDASFQASGFSLYGSSAVARGLAVQSDGKIVLASRYRIGSGPGVQTLPLVRLNADGSLDNTYMPSLTPSDFGRALVLQPDGKAVLAASTSTGNNSVFRFDTNGLVDSSFTPPALVDTSYYLKGISGLPVTLNLQGDGRIIVGGSFTDVNPPGLPNDAHYAVVRLNNDGTVDPSLTTNHKTALEDYPTGFGMRSDGSVLVAFDTQTIKHSPSMNYNLGRLMPDGSIDQNFSLSSSDPGGFLSMRFTATGLARLLDGEFLVSGVLEFGIGAGKFRPDGTQDLGFESDIYPPVFKEVASVPNGRILLAAGDDAQSTVYSTLSSIRRDGSFDNSFQLAASIRSGQLIGDKTFIESLYIGSHILAIQPDGKILFVYLWSDTSSDPSSNFVRLNQDGSIDNTFSGQILSPVNLTFGYPVIFNPFTGATVQPPGGAWSGTSPVQDAHVLSDGRILVCGQFTSYNGVPARGVVRLLPDGTTDFSFDIGGGAQWTTTTETSSFFPSVEAIEEQVDGKLLVAGTFEAFNGVALPGIASLNPDGSVDLSFVPPAKRQKFARDRARLSRQPNGSFLLSGPFSFPNESEPSFIHINNIGGIPVIGSPGVATAAVDQPFNYRIEASGQPTTFVAVGLPPGFAIDPETGLITGTPTSANVGIYVVQITATNGEGTSGAFYLTLSVIPAQTGPLPRLQNISTRLKVLQADNALIGGFIISGPAQRRILVRAIGPSLTSVGISGALADPVLELHGPDPFVTITNDNWKDTQQSEIEATNIPPTNDLESAIVATLTPGAYTAIVRGKNDGTGVGLVEAYDLDSTADTELANISTRGFVDAGENVMIGGLIAGPGNSGSGRALVRAIGPSLTALGVPNALQDPRLELHDSNGALIASNLNWRDTQGAAIEATGIAPTNDNEAAILSVLSPGSYTAVVAGENGETGVGLVEVYNLD